MKFLIVAVFAVTLHAVLAAPATLVKDQEKVITKGKEGIEDRETLVIVKKDPILTKPPGATKVNIEDGAAPLVLQKDPILTKPPGETKEDVEDRAAPLVLQKDPILTKPPGATKEDVEDRRRENEGDMEQSEYYHQYGYYPQYNRGLYDSYGFYPSYRYSYPMYY